MSNSSVVIDLRRFLMLTLHRYCKATPDRWARKRWTWINLRGTWKECFHLSFYHVSSCRAQHLRVVAVFASELTKRCNEFLCRRRRRRRREKVRSTIWGAENQQAKRLSLRSEMIIQVNGFDWNWSGSRNHRMLCDVISFTFSTFETINGKHKRNSLKSKWKSLPSIVFSILRSLFLAPCLFHGNDWRLPRCLRSFKRNWFEP